MNRQMVYMLLVFCCSHLCQGQERLSLTEPSYKRCIRINPLSLAIGALTVSYEKYHAADRSFTFTTSIYSILYSGRFNGLSMSGGARSYFTTKKNSFYAEPFIRYIFLSVPAGSDNINALSVGLIGGRRWIAGKRITFELFGGPMFTKGFYKEWTYTAYPIKESLGPLNGIWFRGGLLLGYQYN